MKSLTQKINEANYCLVHMWTKNNSLSIENAVFVLEDVTLKECEDKMSIWENNYKKKGCKVITFNNHKGIYIVDEYRVTTISIFTKTEAENFTYLNEKKKIQKIR